MTGRKNALFARVPLSRTALAALLLMGMGFCIAAPDAGSDSQVVSDFESRVTKYLDFRKSEAGTAARPTNSPEKLTGNQHDVAAKTKAKRPFAAQGDIFTPEIAAYLRRRISATLSGPEGTQIRASLRHAEPVHGVVLHVNQTYPQGVPLQSTPPSLLLSLPTLPKELEYRIVGRNLVLHDTVPNIVVDFIPNAIPLMKD